MCKPELLFQDFALIGLLFRFFDPVIVQADLADRDDLLWSASAASTLQILHSKDFLCHFSRSVGWKPTAAEDLGMRLCQLNRRQARLPIQAGDQDAVHPSVEGALNDRLAVLIEFVEIQVTVGIGKHNYDKDCENYNIHLFAD